jgi:uncharacterized protein YraI
MSRYIRFAAALAAVGLALFPLAVSAAPGRALGTPNVRSGAGLGYGVVDRLRDDEYVIVIRCTTNWCLIHHIGPDGWVSRKLLVNPYYSTGSGRGYEFPPPTYNRRSTR